MMSRKNTILLAVMINAGLLALLLVVAIATQEELSDASAPPLAGKIEPQPLFDDSIDLVLREESPLTPEPKVVEEASVVHNLPQLLPEAPLAVISAPAVSAPVAMAHETYTVKKGDRLERIASQHHTSVDEILKLNQLPSTFLRVGQVLKVPKAAAAKPPTPAVKKPLAPPQMEYYTVKVGDNPWTIAMKHHMKLEELLELNGLNEERARKLKPGDRLRIK